MIEGIPNPSSSIQQEVVDQNQSICPGEQTEPVKNSQMETENWEEKSTKISDQVTLFQADIKEEKENTIPNSSTIPDSSNKVLTSNGSKRRRENEEDEKGQTKQAPAAAKSPKKRKVNLDSTPHNTLLNYFTKK